MAKCHNSVLNVKALVGAFNQEKALVGAFSVIVKTDCESDGSFDSTNRDRDSGGGGGDNGHYHPHYRTIRTRIPGPGSPAF